MFVSFPGDTNIGGSADTCYTQETTAITDTQTNGFWQEVSLSGP